MFVLHQIEPTSQRRCRTVKLNIQSIRNLLSNLYHLTTSLEKRCMILLFGTYLHDWHCKPFRYRWNIGALLEKNTIGEYTLLLDSLSDIHWFLLLKFAKASKRFYGPWGLSGLRPLGHIVASALGVCLTAGIYLQPPKKTKLPHIEYNLHKNSFINRCLFNYRWLLFFTSYIHICLVAFITTTRVCYVVVVVVTCKGQKPLF